mmetsp:Transcript_16452/g.31204  ORF Transcript_16452/g.31204 Transcript_16452/m.31204 type:complete len:139 (+) Transcript_16452:786-1202(+)
MAHSLNRNPLNDYYCYYCTQHKTYCEYCQTSPTTAYYALYYAGYYSTYLCDYYAIFEADKLDIEKKRSMDSIVSKERQMARYDTLFHQYPVSGIGKSKDKENLIFDTKFAPLFTGLDREVADPNSIASNVTDAGAYFT